MRWKPSHRTTPMTNQPGLVLSATGVMCFLCTTIASSCELGTPSCYLDPARVQWEQISLSASKFFFTASTQAQIQLVDSANIPFISVDQGVPVVPGIQSVELRAESRGIGIYSDSVLWIDPANGAALQFEVEDSGRRQRQRIYRYTNEGAFRRTRHPADGETDKPPEEWTDLTSGMRPYAPEAAGGIIIDPTSLLYIISASGLNQPGDTLQMVAFSRRQTTRLTLTVDQRANIDEALAKRLSGANLTGCKQPVETLLVRLSSELVTPDDDSKFSFLGLRSDIIIWLDPITRLPLRVTGKAKIVGRVSVNLRAAKCR